MLLKCQIISKMMSLMPPHLLMKRHSKIWQSSKMTFKWHALIIKPKITIVPMQMMMLTTMKTKILRKKSKMMMQTMKAKKKIMLKTQVRQKQHLLKVKMTQLVKFSRRTLMTMLLFKMMAFLMVRFLKKTLMIVPLFRMMEFQMVRFLKKTLMIVPLLKTIKIL